MGFIVIEGIIYRALSGFYDVLTVNETVCEPMVRCRARGRFRLEKSTPLVGDRVKIRPTEQGYGVLAEILPRVNAFVRPPLANIDIMVIFASAAIPVTDCFLLDKMIAIAANNNCKPVICINKTDIDIAQDLFNTYKDTGLSVLRTSAVTGEGIDDLINVIKGSVCAFTGNSGVGKSSILNTIDPNFAIETGDISKKLGRGRHTTRHVELYRLSCGAMIADTPGFSAFDTGYIAPKEEIQYLFIEFEPFLGSCRFDDCMHINEPGCNVLEALKEGKLHKSRYESYKQLFEKASEHKEWEH